MADLITNAEMVAAWPGFASLDAGEQAALLSDASQAIRDHCGDNFESVSATETYDGTGLARLWLRRMPITAVSAVTVNGDALDNSQSDAWCFAAATGALVRGDGRDDSRYGVEFPRGTANVSVTYTAGQAPPGPVKRACRILIKHMYASAKATGVMRSESIGDYSYALGDAADLEMPPFVARLLARYVRESRRIV